MVQIESDVYSQIGLVMLIGLAAKNAILIVEFAKEQYEQGKPLMEAALEGARLRLRPILMTSFAFILGAVPLWTASGAGAVARQIMGTAVIGGMLAASLIGIFFIPAIFYLVEKWSGAARQRQLLAAPESAPAEARLDMNHCACLAEHRPSGFRLHRGSELQEAYRRGAGFVSGNDLRRRPHKRRLASLGDQKWWDIFQDEQLRALIRTALQQNYDLRIAASRVLEAQAQLGITRADQFPSLSAGAGIADVRSAQSKFLPAFETSTGQVNLSAAWELDFWGKYRRATEAARANLLASEWARQEVVSTLVANVVCAYFQLRALDLQLEISKRTLDSRQESLRLTRILADGGFDVSAGCAAGRAAGLYGKRGDSSSRTADRAAGKLSQHSLGQNPDDVPRGQALTEQRQPPEVPPDFRRRCWSAGRTFEKRKRSWSRQTRRSAWRVLHISLRSR